MQFKKGDRVILKKHPNKQAGEVVEVKPAGPLSSRQFKVKYDAGKSGAAIIPPEDWHDASDLESESSNNQTQLPSGSVWIDLGDIEDADDIEIEKPPSQLETPKTEKEKMMEFFFPAKKNKYNACGCGAKYDPHFPEHHSIGCPKFRKL